MVGYQRVLKVGEGVANRGAEGKFSEVCGIIKINKS